MKLTEKEKKDLDKKIDDLVKQSEEEEKLAQEKLMKEQKEKEEKQKQIDEEKEKKLKKEKEEIRITIAKLTKEQLKEEIKNLDKKAKGFSRFNKKELQDLLIDLKIRRNKLLQYMSLKPQSTFQTSQKRTIENVENLKKQVEKEMAQRIKEKALERIKGLEPMTTLQKK